MPLFGGGGIIVTRKKPLTLVDEFSIFKVTNFIGTKHQFSWDFYQNVINLDQNVGDINEMDRNAQIFD